MADMLASRAWSGEPEHIFLTTELLLPLVLLVTFLVAAAIHTIASSSPVVAPLATGPGGKPLPVNACKEQDAPAKPCLSVPISTVTKRIFQYVSVALVATFLANGACIVMHALQAYDRHLGSQGGWWCGEERVVYIVGSAFLYVYIVITLFGGDKSPTAVHLFFWLLAFVGESTLLVSSVLAVTGEHHIQTHHRTDKAVRWASQVVTGISGWDTIDLCVAVLRLCFLAFLAGLYTTSATRKYLKEHQVADAEGQRSCVNEAMPLLSGAGANKRTTYHTNNEGGRRRSGDDAHPGADASSEAGLVQQHEHAAYARPEKLPHRNWYEYCRNYRIFFPYLWPADSVKLQLVVLLCAVLVICQRIVNVMVPYQMGVLIDTLEKTEGSHLVPWSQLLLLVAFKSLQGPSGLLGCLRSLLWIPVSQHTFRSLLLSAFEHVHSLSWNFHTLKRTGELLSALNKGSSLNRFLEQLTFSVVPPIVDFLIAIVFFQAQFGAMYALFVSVITFYYIYLTIRMAAMRADLRREMTNAEREVDAVRNESINGFETVKYFNAEATEYKRVKDAVDRLQTNEAANSWGTQHMNTAQNLVFMCGVLVCMLTCAFEVTQGLRTTADFVLLVTYLAQLQGPLNFFGNFYKEIQGYMISAERLLELFKIPFEVVDAPGARPLDGNKCRGHIKWDKVGFSYDKQRPALHDVSFECRPGTTTAFVGESGGGKSTVFRLMYRFLDVGHGAISLDGHNMRDLTIDSVRRQIGVVPQDTTLFNDSIMYNLKYAKPGVTDEEVYAACRAAAIHDSIMKKPQGYNTKVGDKGTRLSGGERQRVAIARTMLKNPKIIMLDEATSALDGETEQKIQSMLVDRNFTRDRTVLVIAHRLSTVTDADQILVLHNGTITERGTHESLLALQGQYAKMWERHCRAERAAERARVAADRAKRLAIQANTTTSPDDEQSDGCSSIASSGIYRPDMAGPSSADNTPTGKPQGKMPTKLGEEHHHHHHHCHHHHHHTEDSDVSDG